MEKAPVDDVAVHPELSKYIRDPVPEEYTVEIFEDLHAVVSRHLVELARTRGSEDSEESIIQDWEKLAQRKIENRRQSLRKQFGALLPNAFVAGEVKMQFLVNSGHPKYQSGKVPDSVIEVMHEFIEIVSYREDFEE